MYVYQNGKLYIHESDKLVGVDFYPDKVLRLEDEVDEITSEAMFLTAYEVRCKFGISSDTPYLFPKVRDIKFTEVENVTVDDIKKPTGNGKRK